MILKSRLISALLLLLFLLPSCNEKRPETTEKSQHAIDTASVNLLLSKASKLLKSRPDSSLRFLALAEKQAELLKYMKGTMEIYAIKGRYFRQNARYDSALIYSKLSIKLSEQINDEITEGFQLIELATIYNQLSKAELAQQTLEKAGKIANKLKDDHLQASFYNISGNVNMSAGKSTEALESYLKAADAFEALKDEPAQAIVLNNIGNIFRKIGNIQEAIKRLKKAAAINTRLEDHYNLSMNFSNLGVMYLDKDSFQVAITNFRNALHYARSVHATQLMAQNFMNLGNTYKRSGNYNLAAAYYDSTRTICNDLNIEYGKLLVLINTGDLHMLRGNLRQAQLNLETAFRKAGSMHLVDQQAEVSRMLYHLFRKSGRYEQALFYKELYDHTNDSILRKNNSLTIQELLDKSDKVKHEKEIEALNHHIESADLERKIIMVLAILAIIVLGFTVFWFIVRNRKTRYEKMLGDIENRNLLLSQELAMQEETKLRKLNETLEENVAARTRELETKNLKLSFHLKEVEQFTYITSHDLQEPLLTLLNYTTLLSEDYSGKLDDTGNKSIEFIAGSAIRMKSMIKGLLDYSLLGNESLLTRVDVKQTIEQVLAEMAGTIRACHATVTVLEMPAVQGYSPELSILFRNLVDNAIKFRKKDVSPEVIISCEGFENEWRFSVEDNGIGISDHEREKIFIMFKQMHNRNEHEGTGIGLALCKKIVILHGGTIRAEPGIKAGCRISFTIPK